MTLSDVEHLQGKNDANVGESAVSLEPSLEPEDDDNDEDFIASEHDDSCSDSGEADSDDDSDSGLVDSDDEESPDFAEAVKRALIEDSIALHEEEVLSDSELSRQFPDEADDEEDEVRHLLGDQFTFSATGNDRATAEGTQNATENADTAPTNVPRHRTAGVKRSRHSLAATATASEVGSHLPTHDDDEEAGGGNTNNNCSTLLQSQDVGNTGSLLPSPGLSLFSMPPANLTPLEMPIAQRTRAHIDLAAVPIEDLELHNTDEAFLQYGIDDDEEYQRFLQSLQQSIVDPMPMPASSLFMALSEDADDSDDEDFLLAMQRTFLGEEQVDKDGFPVRVNKHGKPFRKGPAPRPKYQRPAKNLLPKGERPKYLHRLRQRGTHDAAAVDDANANALPPPREANNTAAAANGQEAAAIVLVPVMNHPDPYMMNPLDSLGTLANAAGLVADVERPLVIPSAKEVSQGKVMLPSQMGTEADANKQTSVVWKKPLPAAVRRKAAEQNNKEEAQEQQQPQAAAVTDTTANRSCLSGIIHPLQCRDLHRLLYQHLQLLVQIHAMAASCGPASVVLATKEMLDELQLNSNLTKQMTVGMPLNYPIPLWGRVPAWNLRVAANEPLDHWVPVVDRSLGTILDISPLRHLPALFEITSQMQAPEEKVVVTSTVHWREKKKQQAEQQQPEEEAEEDEEGPKKKKRRRGKLPDHHELWIKVPPELQSAVQLVMNECDPDLIPKPPHFLPTLQMVFTPAEDTLLAWGIRKHLYDWATIRSTLLPNKTEKQLFNRKKNRVAGSAPDNPIKAVVSSITGPLTPSEIRLLQSALEYYGKQPHRWLMICREHLPYRQPQVLATLWAEHTSGRTSSKKTTTKVKAQRPLANPAVVQPTDDDIAPETSGSEEDINQLLQSGNIDSIFHSGGRTDSAADDDRRAAKDARQARLEYRRQQQQQNDDMYTKYGLTMMPSWMITEQQQAWTQEYAAFMMQYAAAAGAEVQQMASFPFPDIHPSLQVAPPAVVVQQIQQQQVQQQQQPQEMEEEELTDSDDAEGEVDQQN